MRVLPPEDFPAAAKDLETVHKTVLSGGKVGIQIHQRPIIEPDAGRSRLIPAPSWPRDGGANIRVTDADAGESRAGKDEEPRHPADLERCAHLPNPPYLYSRGSQDNYARTSPVASPSSAKSLASFAVRAASLGGLDRQLPERHFDKSGDRSWPLADRLICTSAFDSEKRSKVRVSHKPQVRIESAVRG
jgi:hypothetical protein